MKIKHHEIEIPKDKPFANCKLDREKYALVLTDIVNAYSDGFVLTINNEWGTGKTTFVKMWQQHLNNNEFQTIYFNAWENDFDSNPLVAIMSELDALKTKSNKKLYNTVLEKGAILTKSVLPALVKAVASKYVDTEAITEAVKNVTEGASEIFAKEVEEYANKKKSVIEFRSELEKFINKKESTKPLIFIIDELDRCRPDYAVEVLEQMKHFFSVPGIVFVLSIDKKHLASAVCGFYGSEQINTDEYLRRFIDLEYSIPAPSSKDYCNYLYDYFSFDDFFSSEGRAQFSQFREDADLLLNMARILFNKTNATLRQQEKIFGQTRLILSSFKSNQYTFPHILFVLIYIKAMKHDLYKKIETDVFSLQELSDMFAELMNNGYQERSRINLIYVQAMLLYLYNNNSEDRNKKAQLYELDKDGKVSTAITSRLENNSGENYLARCFMNFNNNWDYERLSLKFFLKNINLTEPINLK